MVRLSSVHTRSRVLLLAGILLGTLVLGNHVLLRSTSAQLANVSGDDRVVNMYANQNDASHLIESEGTWYNWNWMNWTPVATGFNKKTLTATFKDVRSGQYEAYISYNNRYVTYMPSAQPFRVSAGQNEQVVSLNLKLPPPVSWNNTGWVRVGTAFDACSGDVRVYTDSEVTGGSYAWMGMVRLHRVGDASSCGEAEQSVPTPDAAQTYLDVNSDGTVTVAEAYTRYTGLRIMSAARQRYDRGFDLNQDSLVNDADLAIVQAYLRQNASLLQGVKALMFMDRDTQNSVSATEAVTAVQQHALYVQMRGTDAEYDINADGSVNDADTGMLFDAVDDIPDASVALSAFRYMDENEDRALSITEVITHVRGIMSAIQTRSTNLQHDVNGDGVVSPVDLLACTNLLQSYTPLQADYAIFSKLDTNQDRTINPEELQRALQGLRQAIASRTTTVALDMNRDGQVTVADLQLVAHFIRSNPALVSAF